MATAQEKRLMVRDKYRTIIGRNHYSQSLRNHRVISIATGSITAMEDKVRAA